MKYIAYMLILIRVIFLLDEAGRLVLLDFGCVKSFEPDLADDVLKVLPAFGVEMRSGNLILCYELVSEKMALNCQN